ncbi:ribosome maturation factor RimM [uncultured Helicobacter sp.]|uniref:ribosome maturation factor RimM n=1 Tax=uncultured Helicobacter sp. TaxID=175537 RepID=UPI001C39D26F|nr:ribosome maturation factor RimM [Candidatus Helicobacter avicola]
MDKTTESLSKQPNNNLIQIGKLGRTIGFDGSLRLFVQTDFPHSITKGKIYHTSHRAYPSVSVESCEHLPSKDYAKIRFSNINTSEMAQALTNHTLYTTIAQSRQDCVLEEDEFFWFDIIGCEVIESQEILGNVREIERIGNIDYMLITTSSSLQKTHKLPKTFLLPYIEQFIIKTDIHQKHIYTKNARGILENS